MDRMPVHSCNATKEVLMKSVIEHKEAGMGGSAKHNFGKRL